MPHVAHFKTMNIMFLKAGSAIILKMYGLLLDGIAHAIIQKYGEETWVEIRQKAGITNPTFGAIYLFSSNGD